MSIEPRIPPLPYEEWSEAARQLLNPYLVVLGQDNPDEKFESSGGGRPMPAVLGHFARNVNLTKGWLKFNSALAEEYNLENRLREVAVLRVAWRMRSPYEWAQHVRFAYKAGLGADHVKAITEEGPEAAVWTPIERAIVAATDDLIDRHVVSDATWKDLKVHFDDKEVVELLYLIGSYACLAMVLNSIGLQPEPIEDVEVPPLRPLEV